jgi:hypothetical protein
MQYQLNNANEQTINHVLNSMVDDNLNIKLYSSAAFKQASEELMNKGIQLWYIS